MEFRDVAVDYKYMKEEEGRSVLFNEALNTFCLRLYSERGNPCRHMGYSFRLAARVLYMQHPTDRIKHTFVAPVVEHWIEHETAQWVHHEGQIQRPIAPESI